VADGFIHGRKAVFYRPLDPRDGNEWIYLGDVVPGSAVVELKHVPVSFRQIEDGEDVRFGEIVNQDTEERHG
jgi:hypothetical protein